MHRNLGDERFGDSDPGWSSSGDKGHGGCGDHELKCLKHIGRKNSWQIMSTGIAETRGGVTQVSLELKIILMETQTR